MATAGEWRRAYAKQATADLKAHELLLKDGAMPACQNLHFLQMACEKTCKAYLCGRGTDPRILQRSHAYIARPLSLIARQQLSRLGHGNRSWALRAIQVLARRIELLAPAIDAAGTVPANCEYPWLDSAGIVRTPAEHNFGLDLRKESAGPLLIKVLQSLLNEILSERER